MSKKFSLLGRSAQDKTPARAEDEASKTPPGENEAAAAAAAEDDEAAEGGETTEEKKAARAADGSAKVVDIDSARQDGYAAAAEITELCTLAGRPELAVQFQREGKTAAQVRNALLEAKAEEGDRTAVHGANSGGPLTHAESARAWDNAFARAVGR